jgi:hypothetical protein
MLLLEWSVAIADVWYGTSHQALWALSLDVPRKYLPIFGKVCPFDF